MEGLGINLGYLIVQVGAFVVLVLLMKAFAYDPIIRMLEERQQRMAKANQDAKKIVAEAAEDATEERDRILANLRSQVAAISIAAANKLVGETLDEKRQHAIIADFFAQVPDEVSGMSGDTAEVTSALPLDDKEKAQVKKSLNVKEVNFKVDPNILGGLVIRVGDRVIDDSVANQMGEMRESLLG